MVFLTKLKKVVDMIFYIKNKKNDKNSITKTYFILYLNKKYIVNINNNINIYINILI